MTKEQFIYTINQIKDIRNEYNLKLVSCEDSITRNALNNVLVKVTKFPKVYEDLIMEHIRTKGGIYDLGLIYYNIIENNEYYNKLKNLVDCLSETKEN